MEDTHPLCLEKSHAAPRSLLLTHTRTQVKGVSHYVIRAAVAMRGAEGAVVSVEGCG